MSTVLKLSLLTISLATLSGGVMAKECPSDTGSTAPPALESNAGQASDNIVYLNPYDLIRAQEALMNQEFNALNAMWFPVINAPMPSMPIGFAMPMPVQPSALVRTANGYKLQVNVPGFSPDDIHVQLNGRLLNISANRSIDKNIKTGNSPGQEVSERSFSETISLPPSVNGSGMVQKVQNGVLTITIPTNSGSTSGGKV
jgi:HSP20 family molecular chaperone IbpA